MVWGGRVLYAMALYDMWLNGMEYDGSVWYGVKQCGLREHNKEPQRERGKERNKEKPRRGDGMTEVRPHM